MIYDIPMAEVVLDFFDRLKSVSRGYASLDYGLSDEGAAVPFDVLINDRVDVHHCIATMSRGRVLTEKMKESFHGKCLMWHSAAVGGKIVARQTVKALRKNVTAKCQWR